MMRGVVWMVAGLPWLLLAAAPLGAGGALAAEPDATERLGQCLGREDPACAAPWVAQLQKAAPGSWSADFSSGYVDFLAGKLDAAHAALQRVAGATQAPAAVRERAQQTLELTESTMEVHAGAKAHTVAGGRVVVWLRPGADEVLLTYLDRVLGKTLPGLEAAFGRVEGPPVQVHIYPKTEDLSRVSGLTVEQIRTSGTVALCKYNRIMVTSPADLVFGYPWADTVAHEMVHWFIIKRGGPGVPIWLHEGLARSFEGAWRGHAAGELDREERSTLAQARKRGKFITLQRMSPSMALLPSQDDTQLAFAEVHHAVAWLLARAARAEQPSASGQAAAAQAGRLVALFGAGQDESEALLQFSGLAPVAFQAQWKHDLQKADLGDATAGEGRTRAQYLVFRGAGPATGARPMAEQARKFAELGDHLAALKRPQAAAIEYRKAIAAGAHDGPLLVARLVRVLLDLGRFAEAQDYLGPALEEYPQHAPLFVLRGRAEAAQGHWKGALDALDLATWLNPYDPQLHELAALAYDGLGLAADAAAARQRAQQLAAAGP